ncbi:FAD-binding protein [Thermoactinospora rubra]|uniref:FAD-binding protein n=1 Tax=Thermoactinospora rubra TaxID=1088767 RepID=UPI000A11D39B|nr:FAD-binding protein [Thermoactinospora rubra]
MIRNWAGNVTYRAGRLHRPESIEELRALVARTSKIRAMGTGHSFNTLADSPGELVSLERLPYQVEIDSAARKARVGGGMTYAQVCPRLHEHGFALRNLASLPHIGIAGAVATGTHGSGAGNRCLAAEVAGLELVTADGDVVELSRGEPGFDGAVVSLGALGVVTALTLDLVPAYELRQYVFEDASPEDYAVDGYSVSVFTDWNVSRLWVKDAGEPRVDAPPADGPRHPIPGMSPEHCTRQLGVPGPWHERLPHFRAEFTPSAGEELQSEFMLPRNRADEALRALAEIGDRVRPVLHISEIRTIAADELWLSPCRGRDTVAVHFTWVKAPERVLPVIELVEEVLRPFDPRPHWGKVFTRFPEPEPRFRELADRFDPRGKFRNDLLTGVLG